MFIFTRSAACCSTIALMALPSLSQAELVETYEIGQGDAMAHIQFDFMVGRSYLYKVRWDGLEMTGRDVFDLIDAAQPDNFDFTYISYSFGDFLTSVTIDDDFHAGDGSEPPDYNNYWQYWNRTAGESWQSSMIGFSDRILEDGSWDGWVFGVTDAPRAIPAPATIGVVGAVFASRRRRRRLT